MAISVNKVTLVGRLGADPERRGNNGPVVFSIATSESWKDRQSGEKREKTQWHSIVVWNETAQNFLLDYAKKGDLLYVEGQLETSEYEKEGQRHFKTDVVVKPFGGVVQLQSKDSGDRGSDRSSDRGEDRGGSRYESGRGGSSSSRPGASRAGQSRPAFDPGGMDDDIPF